MLPLALLLVLGQGVERDPVVALLDHARAAPAEVYADLALRLIERGRVPPAAKVKILEEIFERAGEAREPLPVGFVVFEEFQVLPSDQITWREVQTSLESNGVDGLSLRCRAVQLLAREGNRRARTLFEEIPTLETPVARCEDHFVRNAYIYFQTLLDVLQHVPFTDEEKKRQEPQRLLERAFGRVFTSSDLAALLWIVPEIIKLPSGQGFDAADLAASFSAALGRVNDCDRAFSHAVDERFINSTFDWAGELWDRGEPSVTLLAALRGFLARHLRAERCGGVAGSRRKMTDAFNRRAVAWDIPELPPLSEDEQKPAKAGAPYQRLDWPNGAELAALIKEIRSLPSRIREPERFKLEAPFKELLRRVESWKGVPGLSAMDLFRQKAILWEKLLGHEPTEELERKTMAGLAGVLSDPRIMQENPAAWLSYSLLFLTDDRSPEAWRSRIVAALRDSPDPWLSLYAQLAAIKYGRDAAPKEK